MYEDRSSLPSFAIAGGGILVAALSILGLLPATPVDSDRIHLNEPSADAYPAVKDTVSLSGSKWDDPFFHLSKPILTNDREQKSDTSVRDLIHEKLRKSKGNIMFLVIPLDSGFEPERVELRSRARHAFELALANQEFSLMSPDRMTYRMVDYQFDFLPLPAASSMPTSEHKNPLKTWLPTKLYSNRSDDLIVVTWIQDSHLGAKPLNAVRQILKDLVPCGSSDVEMPEKTSFCLLPNSSDLFKLITDEVKAVSSYRSESNSANTNVEDARGVQSFFESIKGGAVLCNAVGTANDTSLGLEDGATKIELGKRNDGTAIDLRIIHTINSDELLFTALCRELRLRGVLTTEKSRNLTVIFAEQSSQAYLNDLQNYFDTSPGGDPPIIIPYLEGIASRGGAHPSEATGSKVNSLVEDYLNRSMVEFSTSTSGRGINSNQVCAVGIVGSNWQDKNLILQKARRVFPVATFFTTELDARYNLPEVIGHTRNLIVASHYGLLIKGRPDIFGRVNNLPSFRDGYQTSRFVAASVLCSGFREHRLNSQDFVLNFGKQPQNLYDLVGRRSKQSRTENVNLSPLTFEIGTYHAVQLDGEITPDYVPLRQPPGVKSILSEWHRIWIAVVFSIGAALILNFLVPYSNDLRRSRDLLKKKFDSAKKSVWKFLSGSEAERSVDDQGTHIIVSTLVCLFVFAVMIVCSFSGESEPMLFTNGVSLWPPIWGLTLVVCGSISTIIDAIIPAKNQKSEDRIMLSGALKLALTVTLVFYAASFLISGYIEPPARQWIVRMLAVGLQFFATLFLLVVTFKALVYCLNSRKVIADRASTLNPSSTEDPPAEIGVKQQHELVVDARETMYRSIRSSRMLFHPAILAMLLIASRWHVWDAWGLDIAWYFLLAFPILVSCLAAFVVRLTAIAYRRKVLQLLRRVHYEFFCELKRQQAANFKTGGRKSNETEEARKVPADLQGQIDLLEESEKEILRLSEGPYGPVSQDYLLGAAVLILTFTLTGPGSILLKNALSWLA